MEAIADPVLAPQLTARGQDKSKSAVAESTTALLGVSQLATGFLPDGAPLAWDNFVGDSNHRSYRAFVPNSP